MNRHLIRHRPHRWGRVLGLLALIAVLLTVQTARASDPLPENELHAAYCVAVFDHNVVSRQAQMDEARTLADQLTVAGKMRTLSDVEKADLENAGTNVRRAADALRHWNQASDRMKSFLMSRGYVSEGHVVLPSPDMSGEAVKDIETCGREKDRNASIFTKCSADCEGKDGACYLACVDMNASKSCRGIWSCSGNDFLPF